ncbi:putative LRR receptor-like serine/threonine-protein kinase [Camellia lanceoleosa]|uniref:LRR receptor-like serine/threonine-protein kinase n=1 Tax=Camellia lanceoleosa TaxID=1840588 RepID=A0ACC0GR35_9ERIC|nr:putative LRR receptor-like serine/threonine-protein kinase [Camellia lanceoleosa]
MKDGSIVNMSLPIVLAIDDQAKERIGASIHVALVGPDGDLVGVLRSLISKAAVNVSWKANIYSQNLINNLCDHSTKVDKVFSVSLRQPDQYCCILCLNYVCSSVKPVWGLQVKRRLPEAPYYEISPAGHCPHDEVPEDFFRYLNESIPIEVVGLKRLLVFRLGNNTVDGTVPAGFESIELLEVLDLHNLKLVGNIPEEISNCKFLL